jgi:N-acetylneuraminic acid mutarotase
MPTARYSLATAVVNGKIYTIGGGHYTYNSNYQVVVFDTVEEYDPITDNWTTKTSMPTARTGLATAVVNGKIYAIGGRISDGSTISTVEEYDPITDSWTTKTSLPSAPYIYPFAGTLCAVEVDGKIYTRDGSDNVVEYDPSTDTWTTKNIRPSGPQTIFFGSAVVVDEKIYFLFWGNVAEYDLLANVISEKTSPSDSSASVVSAVTVDGKIYSIGSSLVEVATPPLSNRYIQLYMFQKD